MRTYTWAHYGIVSRPRRRAVAGVATTETQQTQSQPGRIATPVRRLVKLLLFAFVVIHFVLPQIAGVRRSIHLLEHVNLWLVLLGMCLEAVSIMCYTNLTRAVLPRGKAPPYFTLLRIQLSTLAVSHVVPGGSAAGGALGYRLLTREGLSGTDAAFAQAAQGIGSAVILNLLLWLALIVSIPLHGYNPLYLAAAIIGVVLIGGFAAIILLLMRGDRRAANVVHALARRIPILDADKAEQVVLRLATRLKTLVRDRAMILRGILWDLGFWLFTAAPLWVFVGAFGHWVRLDGLLIAFGLGYVVAALPITPSGLGLVEGMMIPLLVLFGTDRGVATLGVLTYRLVNFWLPIPIGGLCYLSLEAQNERRLAAEGRAAARRRRREEELAELAEQSLRDAEDPHHWAERHGLKVHHPSDRDAPPAD